MRKALAMARPRPPFAPEMRICLGIGNLMAGAGEPGGLSLVGTCVRCDDSVVTDTSLKKFASKGTLPASEDGKAVTELRLEGESRTCPRGKGF